MNIVGIIGLVMLITGIFIAGGLLIDDFETNYVETNISSSISINQSLKDSLVTKEEINETVAPLIQGVEKIGQSTGWLDFLTEGAIVLPAMFIDFIGATFIFIVWGTQQSFAVLKYLGTPVALLVFIGIAIIAWFFFKIVEQVRRYPT